MRRAARTDANQTGIVNALRGAGCFVQSLAAVGSGCPDLLVWHRNRWLLMEVKDGSKKPSERKLTPDQIEWHGFVGPGAVHVVKSIEDALGALQ